MKKCIDVTNEYMNNKKEYGIVQYSSMYNIKEHIEEIDIAIWVHNNLGGNIKLLDENNKTYKVKTADFEWNGKLWELKTLNSEKSIDSAVRKAISQIFLNPGGVILNFNNSDINISKIELVVKKRIETSCRFKIDIIIINKKKLIKVLRYI